MKLSILLGVAHMTFGLACKTANCLHFRRWRDLLLENVAEVRDLHLLCTSFTPALHLIYTCFYLITTCFIR